LLVYWRDSRKPGESFGDFASRVGLESLTTFQASYKK